MAVGQSLSRGGGSQARKLVPGEMRGRLSLRRKPDEDGVQEMWHERRNVKPVEIATPSYYGTRRILAEATSWRHGMMLVPQGSGRFAPAFLIRRLLEK